MPVPEQANDLADWVYMPGCRCPFYDFEREQCCESGDMTALRALEVYQHNMRRKPDRLPDKTLPPHRDVADDHMRDKWLKRAEQIEREADDA